MSHPDIYTTVPELRRRAWRLAASANRTEIDHPAKLALGTWQASMATMLLALANEREREGES